MARRLKLVRVLIAIVGAVAAFEQRPAVRLDKAGIDRALRTYFVH